MNNTWQNVRLGDLVSIKHGWPFKSELFSEELTGKPIVVAVGNFDYAGGFRFDKTKTKEYRGDFPTEYILSAGEILLVMTCQTAGGEILGIPAQVPNDGRTYLHNQRLGKVVILRKDLLDSNFLYQLFRWSEFNRELYVTASGTKILHTAPSRIEAFRFDLPSLAEQKSIASILATLDDKIELNRRMNETLESIARALFKSWFVDFDPVRAKVEGRQPVGMDAYTTGLFPDSFDNSDLGEIPRGWRTTKLYDAITIHDSVRIPLSNKERASRSGIYPYYGAASRMDYVDDFLFDGIYLLVGEDGSVINDDDTPVLQYVWGKFWVNNHAHVLTGKNDVSVEQLLLFLKRANFRPFVTGAVQPKINQGNLCSVPFLLPPKEINRAFNILIAPLFAKIRQNYEESESLSEIRDTVLPKLISGEVELHHMS